MEIQIHRWRHLAREGPPGTDALTSSDTDHALLPHQVAIVRHDGHLNGKKAVAPKRGAANQRKPILRSPISASNDLTTDKKQAREDDAVPRSFRNAPVTPTTKRDPPSWSKFKNAKHLDQALLDELSGKQKQTIHLMATQQDPASQIANSQRKMWQAQQADRQEKTAILGGSMLQIPTLADRSLSMGSMNSIRWASSMALQPPSTELAKADSLFRVLERYDAVHPGERVNAQLRSKHLNVPNQHQADSTSGGGSSASNQSSPWAGRKKPAEEVKLATTKKGKPLLIKDQHWTLASPSGKSDLLQELYEFVEEELDGVDGEEQRLAIYSAAFDRIIGEFRQFGPILARIKHAYDTTIEQCHSEQTEIQHLRSKVQKLAAQNENRELLKAERNKGVKLEKQVERLLEENDGLKEELARKLQMYAEYLPPIKRLEIDKVPVDPAYKVLPGQDPISKLEYRIDELQQQNTEHKEHIQSLEEHQRVNLVPIQDHRKLQQQLQQTELQLAAKQKHNEEMELELHQKKEQTAQLQKELESKEQAYEYLLQEYNELSESMVTTEKKIALEQEAQAREHEHAEEETIG